MCNGLVLASTWHFLANSPAAHIGWFTWISPVTLCVLFVSALHNISSLLREEFGRKDIRSPVIFAANRADDRTGGFSSLFTWSMNWCSSLRFSASCFVGRPTLFHWRWNSSLARCPYSCGSPTSTFGCSFDNCSSCSTTGGSFGFESTIFSSCSIPDPCVIWNKTSFELHNVVSGKIDSQWSWSLWLGRRYTDPGPMEIRPSVWRLFWKGLDLLGVSDTPWPSFAGHNVSSCG